MKLQKRIISIMLIACILTAITVVPVSAASTVTNVTNNAAYYIQHVGSNKYLDITDESTSNGARLQIWSKYANHQNQVFELKKVGNYWKIIAHNSGKAIEVRDSRTEDRAPVAQWDYVGIACQQWKSFVIQMVRFHFRIGILESTWMYMEMVLQMVPSLFSIRKTTQLLRNLDFTDFIPMMS